MTITPQQVKAARQQLSWSQSDLAGHVGVSAATIWAFESGRAHYSTLDLNHVRAALESAGVIFVEENGEGPGVRLRKGKP
jgi:transcriptional regulator with XRE-family HTH domain